MGTFFSEVIARNLGSGVPRKEDQNNIKYHIPAELYDVEAGQIVLFVSKDGFDYSASQKINDLFYYLERLDIRAPRMNVITTDNADYLIDNIACRSPKAQDGPYQVAVGSWKTTAGIIAQYTGIPVEDVVEKLTPLAEQKTLPISSTELPDVVSINPDNKPMGMQNDAEDGDFMEAKMSSSSRITEADIIAKLIDLLSECMSRGYDLDLNNLKERIEDAKNNMDNYHFRLDLKQHNHKIGHADTDILEVCDVYICDDRKESLLALVPGQKALFLTCLLHNEGFEPSDPSIGFLDDMAEIYRKIPGKSERGTKTGILNKEQSTNNIASMRSHIRVAITNAAPYKPLVDLMAIEGERGDLFSIQKSTPELREQIRKAFKLD